jgi:hypothetical protein
MRAKKQIGRNEERPDKARLNAIRAERAQLVNRVWRAEKTIERDRRLIGQLDELIAKSKQKS